MIVPALTRVAVVGIGNTLAGDDGAGVVAVERLRRRLGRRAGVSFHVLGGDLLAVSDLLPLAERVLFVDAVIGEPPGRVVEAPRTFGGMAASLHQTDIGAAMRTLEALEVVSPFPAWELWGVTIAPPRELREGLTSEVDEGVDALCRVLTSRIERLLAE